MWDINLKVTNEQDNKQRLMDMYYRLVVTREEGTGEGEGRQGKGC